MTAEGRFVFGWFVVIVLLVSFITGAMGVYNSQNRKEKKICGLMSFTSVMALILVSNSLVV